MKLCYCGSKLEFDACCALLIAGRAADSPEALMRSRYSAFVSGDLEYLRSSLAPDVRGDFDLEDTEQWAKNSKWQSLEIRRSFIDAKDDNQGIVEFVACYNFQGKPVAHHELAHFRKEEGRWYYVDGEINPKEQQRVVEKIGRNDPCSCGSGKKYKKCCGV